VVRLDKQHVRAHYERLVAEQRGEVPHGR
jgi:hypothetical protein